MTSSHSIILPGYQIQLHEDGPLHSRTKLESAATDFARNCQVDPSVIHSKPCATQKETVQYRCTCSFQMILDEDHNYHYAMRTHGQAIRIGTNAFPIATLCIQNVMKLMICHLNNTDNKCNIAVRKHLSSVSFVSSWNEGRDCIVTMNYGEKINPDDTVFLKELEQLRLHCQVTTLIARSKKIKIELGRVPPYIEDDILLTNVDHGGFQVSLNENAVDYMHQSENQIMVSYRKPEDAFQHPNGNTMIQALSWMLNRLQSIQNDLQTVPQGSRYLLEMYCGCGAHTMAISKAKLFDFIVAVEMDQRLVDACIYNCKQNDCSSSDEGRCDSNQNTINPTPVQVFQGDAGDFAAKAMKKKDTVPQGRSVHSKSYWQSQPFQVLLVDPPRGGLDKHVLNLAINGSFQHLIYISCGKNALIRDLMVLSSVFEVVDCTLTDLFPRTDSVETLLHLKRRNRIV